MNFFRFATFVRDERVGSSGMAASSWRTAATIAVFCVAGPLPAPAAPATILGAALGMTLPAAMDALTRSGAICGRGVFDSHRCDFDSDTWVHLHVTGPDKVVAAIRYTYPPMRDPEKFAAFRSKVVARYGLNPVDNRSTYLTPHGAAFTITDGEIDLESDLRTPPFGGEPRL